MSGAAAALEFASRILQSQYTRATMDSRNGISEMEGTRNNQTVPGFLVFISRRN